MGILSSGIVRDAPPKDGLWEGGRNLGVPVGYQTWGWSRDLVEMPDIQSTARVGITHAQILAGLSVTVQGYLRWSYPDAVAAGASQIHRFRLVPPQALWEPDSVQFLMNFWRGAAANNGHQNILCGMDTVYADGAPAIISGASDSRLYEGLEYTSASGYRRYAHLAPHMDIVLGSGSGGFGLQIFPQKSRMAGIKTPIGKSKATNSTTQTVIDDPRPTGTDPGGYYWQPYIEIIMHDARPTTSEFEFFFYSFLVSGIPKAT